MHHKIHIRFLLVGLVVIVIGLAAWIFLVKPSKMVPVKPLKMAVVTGTTAAVERERYKPIVEYLGEQIGRPIDLTIATDYSTAITSLKIGDADMARLGAFAYILAVKEARVEIIAKELKKSTGKDSYYGYIIAKTDSGIKTLEDIKDKTFAFVDVASASGYLVPQAMFKSAGIDPEKDFAKTFFAGTHPAVIETVKRGKVDAGAINDYRYEDALASGAISEGELIIIAKSPAIPNPPIVVKSGMNEGLKKKIQDAFLAMPADIAENAKLLGYVKAVDSDYDYLREVAKILNLDLAKME